MVVFLIAAAIIASASELILKILGVFIMEARNLNDYLIMCPLIAILALTAV